MLMRSRHVFLMMARPALMAGLVALALCPVSALAQDGSVLTYHADNSRSGQYVVPALSWEKARSLQVDRAFNARVAGSMYAQPLYWRPPGANTVWFVTSASSGFGHAISQAALDHGGFC